MRSAAVRGIWCSTCGTYIRPGTHGIHAMNYGDGARQAPPRTPEIGGAQAVAFVVMLVAGLGAGAFLVLVWLLRTG
jgi:hypothetical protein